jgi:hypothetical protein
MQKALENILRRIEKGRNFLLLPPLKNSFVLPFLAGIAVGK